LGPLKVVEWLKEPSIVDVLWLLVEVQKVVELSKD
jgi:hypothetical protein